MSSSLASSSALQLHQANGSSYHSYTSDLPLNDALPYFDREIETHPGLQGRVEREIQNELAKTPKVNESRLPPALEVFQVSTSLSDHPSHPSAESHRSALFSHFSSYSHGQSFSPR